jgi:hypothetical protein
MNRRDFVKMAPAFPAAAVTATLTLRENGKDPVELDVSVLKLQRGDTVVLRCHERVTKEMADRIKGDFSSTFEDMGVKAMVLDKTVSIEGVLRG